MIDISDEVCEAMIIVQNFLDKNDMMMCIARKGNTKRKFTIASSRESREHGDFGRIYGETNIRQRRKAEGLTQLALANRVGTYNKAVIRLEDNTLGHSEIVLRKFADYYGCKISDLLVDEDDIAIAKEIEELEEKKES